MGEVGNVRRIGPHRNGLRTDLLHRGIQFRLAAAGDVHIGSLLGETLGGRQSDARAAAGDNCDFSFKLFGHDTLSVECAATPPREHDLSITQWLWSCLNMIET